MTITLDLGLTPDLRLQIDLISVVIPFKDLKNLRFFKNKFHFNERLLLILFHEYNKSFF